jgi:hypothetical protein
MTDQEYVERLLELSAEFTKLVASDDRLASQIPPGAVIVFQIAGETEFNQRAMAMAQERRAREPSVPVIVVRIDGLAPPASRLINPHLEPASL